MAISGINIDIGSALTGIGTLAKDIRSAITGDIGPEKKADLAILAANIEAQANQAQTAINATEAAHASVFVAGWRPAIGWVCASALAWNFVGHPVALWAVAVFGIDTQPPAMIATDWLFELVLAMLGMGALRSFEKLKGVARGK